MSADNKAIIRRLYEEVWNKRKLEVISEIISPSHALHGPNVAGSAVGPEAYKRQLLAFLAGYPAPTEATTWEFPQQIRKYPWTESPFTTWQAEKSWIPTAIGTFWE